METQSYIGATCSNRKQTTAGNIWDGLFFVKSCCMNTQQLLENVSDLFLQTQNDLRSQTLYPRRVFEESMFYLLMVCGVTGLKTSLVLLVLRNTPLEVT